MKLSQTDKNLIGDLTIEQKSKIVFGNYCAEGIFADVALVLGGKVKYMPERVKTAAKLYFEGRVKYVLPSGGVEWDCDGEMLSESLYMTRMLKNLGVPDDAIIIENEARIAKENMIYATLQINRVIGISHLHRVIVVTSPNHVRRSVGIAKCLMPKNIEILGYAADTNEGSREHWFENEEMIERVEKEVLLLKRLVDTKIIEDIEY